MVVLSISFTILIAFLKLEIGKNMLIIPPCEEKG